MKEYQVSWKATIAGTAHIEAESKWEAVKKFHDEPMEYTEDDSERPYEYDHKIEGVDEMSDSQYWTGQVSSKEDE